MSASVAQVLSSWMSAAGLERSVAFFRGSPLALRRLDLALTRGSSVTPRLLAEMRAGE